jgi:hypothetical protein
MRQKTLINANEGGWALPEMSCARIDVASIIEAGGYCTKPAMDEKRRPKEGASREQHRHIRIVAASTLLPTTSPIGARLPAYALTSCWRFIPRLHRSPVQPTRSRPSTEIRRNRPSPCPPLSCPSAVSRGRPCSMHPCSLFFFFSC